MTLTPTGSVPTAVESPRLLEPLKNVQTMVRETTVLSCQISAGEPASDVHWYRSGKICKMFREITDDAKYEMSRKGDTLSLIIAVSEATDSAIYRCEVVNKIGKVRTECRLHVRRTSSSLYISCLSASIYTVCQKTSTFLLLK